jgi:hypothetical protein
VRPFTIVYGHYNVYSSMEFDAELNRLKYAELEALFLKY